MAADTIVALGSRAPRDGRVNKTVLMKVSTYALESLREDGDFVLYRGRRVANPHILVVVPSSKHPAIAM